MPNPSPQAALFARLCEADAEFRRLVQQHRALDEKILAFDRIYYLNSMQERQRKELQKKKLHLKDQLQVMMIRAESHDGQNGTGASG